MKVMNTPGGLRLLREGGQSPVDIVVIYGDDKRGLWMLIGTDHAAVEVHVTPAGRKVTTEQSHRRPGQFMGR